MNPREQEKDQPLGPEQKLGEVALTPENIGSKEKEATENNQAAEKFKAESQQKPSAKLPIMRKPTSVPLVRDELAVKIEKIMEEGLADAYQRLSPVARQEFKLRGEETATKIQELLRATHVKVKKIFHLIFEWLKMLPGVNRFFLEQEAKIKTDRVLSLNKKEENTNKLI